jgi:hypothetical protein
LWWSATTGAHVGFESWLERDHVMLLDFDALVVGIVSQPFWLSWQDGAGSTVTHCPDYFARRTDDSAVVIHGRHRSHHLGQPVDRAHRGPGHAAAVTTRHRPTDRVTLAEALPGFAARLGIAAVTLRSACPGMFLLSVQLSVFRVPNPSVTPTSLQLNVIAAPGALLRHGSSLARS